MLAYNYFVRYSKKSKIDRFENMDFRRNIYRVVRPSVRELRVSFFFLGRGEV